MPSLKINRRNRVFPRSRAVCVGVCLLLLTAGCFQNKDSTPLLGKTSVVPQTQELRWHDGGLPREFDPARANTPYDMDAVRALYEGLTDYAPPTFAITPAVAESWEASPDNKQWTFHLRRNALWSNGETVTAQDFVRSWQRVVDLGEAAPNGDLLKNIAGYPTPTPSPTPTPETNSNKPAPQATPTDQAVVPNSGDAKPPAANVKPDANPKPNDKSAVNLKAAPPNVGNAQELPSAQSSNGQLPPGLATAPKAEDKTEARPKLSVAADGDFTLRVMLEQPNPTFPALLGHPVFRPVPRDFDARARNENAASIVGNGAFRLTAADTENVVLERSATYWNVARVPLERLRFVGAADAQAALKMYRDGKLDAVSNVRLEPLALKLLAPYRDFRRATYGALTYYGFNRAQSPLADARVRQALTLAVNRQRITEDDLDGATAAANGLLPDKNTGSAALESPADAKRDNSLNHRETAADAAPTFDPERARKLLSDAGYSAESPLPTLRLLINRNEQQRQVAQTIIAGWQRELGVKVEIIIKEQKDYEAALATGDYDIARRNFILRTPDATTNLRALAVTLEPLPTNPLKTNPSSVTAFPLSSMLDELLPRGTFRAPAVTPAPTVDKNENGIAQNKTDKSRNAQNLAAKTPDEQSLLEEYAALPLYFATTYALVKPYIEGFEPNVLDAPALQQIRVNTAWQTPPADGSNNWLGFE